jgi:hypothetical protein
MSTIPTTDFGDAEERPLWRFVPARRGHEPIAASVIVRIVFRLE